MIIRHTLKHRWIKKIHPQILPDFGKSNTKRITTLLDTLHTSTISHSIKLLEPDDIVWFEHHYNVNLAKKHNPKPHDVYKTTLGKDNIVYPYYILSLFENNEPVGGTIFTIREDRLSMVYRTYSSNWKHHSFKCSPALYAEYLATAHALEQNVAYLVHGKDPNPYGINSHVGVAIFKLSTGCHPDINITILIKETDLDTLPFGSLLLEQPTDGTRIKKAYLIGDEETAKKYEQLFKYPSQLEVVLYTPTI